MKLVIHDLDSGEWEKVRGEYQDCVVITDNGRMHPCIGCFSCWNRTPGICAVHDGYENMGSLIHHADEVIVISRYTYGGFSGSVKNVFDRCLGYVLPQFEVTKGETHHKKRYDENKPFTFIFRGSAISDIEKDSARKYVQAVCNNIRGYVKSVRFDVTGEVDVTGKTSDEKCEASGEIPAPRRSGVRKSAPGVSGKTVLLNGSMRNTTGNSARLARKLSGMLGAGAEIIDLKSYMRDMDELIRILDDVQKLVLCVPLYVDGLPSQVIRFMEKYERHCGAQDKDPERIPGKASEGAQTKLYVLANMGLYESSQLENLFSAARQWCSKAGLEYCGGLGISAGELLGTLMEVIPFRMGPTKKAAEGMKLLADAINDGRATEDIYEEPHRFPRWLYIAIANVNWNRTARKNGLKPEDLLVRL